MIRQVFMAVVALMVMSMSGVTVRGEDVTALYEARSHKAAQGRYAESPLAYRLMKPATLEPGKQYPLVVFLHGAGERGNDNAKQLAYLPTWLAEPEMREKFPCYVVAPQCPDGRVWGSLDWRQKKTNYDEQLTDELAAVVAIVEQLIASEAIDADRVYLTGLSMGGYGTWELATRRRDLFAAAAPLCGGGDATQVKPLVDLPLWAWHGDQDPVIDIERSREMIAAIKAAGGTPRFTEVRGGGHAIWGPAYRNEDGLLPWLFEQKRKKPDA